MIKLFKLCYFCKKRSISKYHQKCFYKKMDEIYDEGMKAIRGEIDKTRIKILYDQLNKIGKDLNL